MVPAAKACEVGLDRSMIGAYGHDDRVCAYAAFAPLLDLDVPSYTAVCVLADKEEIPPRVEYALSEKGRSVIPILQSICQWAGGYYKEEEAHAMTQCQKCDYH